jgi:hypothetical protein
MDKGWQNSYSYGVKPQKTNMLCPRCNAVLHQTGSGQMVCHVCGYQGPEGSSRSWFASVRNRYILLGAALAVLLVGFIGYQEVRAITLVRDARLLEQQLKFAEANTLLKQADGLLSLPDTRQAVTNGLELNQRWQTDEHNIIQAKSLMADGRYAEAIALLKQVKPDYPGYEDTQLALADASLSHSGVLVEKGMTLPQAGNDTSTSGNQISSNGSSSPIPPGSSSLATPKVTTAPKTTQSGGVTTQTPAPSSSSPSTTPAPPPNYVVINAYCKVDANQSPDLYDVAAKIADVCKSAYPQIVQKLSPALSASPHPLTFTSSGFSNGAVAYTTFASGSIIISIPYLHSQPNDMGLVVHELTHVVQGYANVTVPSWIVEGMADYMRFDLGYSTSWSYQHCDAKSRYTSGYNCAAAFLKYIQINYMSYLIKDLHNTIRAGKYTSVFFSGNTGKTLDQLYAECLNAECKGGAA